MIHICERPLFTESRFFVQSIVHSIESVHALCRNLQFYPLIHRQIVITVFTFNRMLVYEFVNNGNLEQWLHGAMCQRGVFSWENRMKVVTGTAKA
jgi:hypothetical protein